ncbi:MAG: hypothetical protein COB67_06630 [SAR324 cluster bacterium]|uniref:Uncharacterized protein n=1 Tax=SAR324 cluster bacterium TaxID=2024889 RepID=A0A2A4T3T8_9DELT|nr:MAG: hypothetical protein COB67_06630 [SAR324 cluster bacterium]
MNPKVEDQTESPPLQEHSPYKGAKVRRIIPLLGILISLIIFSSFFFLFEDHPTISKKSLAPYQTVELQSLMKQYQKHINNRDEPLILDQEALESLSALSGTLVSPLQWRAFLFEDSMLLRLSILIGKDAASRYLNIDMSGQFEVQDRTPIYLAERLTIGKITVPKVLVDFVTRIILRKLWQEPQWGLAQITNLKIQNNQLYLSYSGEIKFQALAKFYFSKTQKGMDRPSHVQSTYQHIMKTLKQRHQNLEAFSLIIHEAFRHVSTLQAVGITPQQGNRIALMALGLTMGGSKAQQYSSMDSKQKRLPYQGELKEVQLYGRHDWARHFLIAAALVASLGEELSDTLSTNKEILDQATSGFSFGDLMADRAGIAFAKLLSESEENAKYHQGMIAFQFILQDYIPNPKHLPEDLPSNDFEQKFGFLQSQEYQKLIRKIDQQIKETPAYQ